MLTQPTIEKLCTMRLRGMAEAFQQQQQDANIHGLSFEERLGLLIDRQWNWRQNRALERRLSGVNYFFGLTTTISPDQRQLLFDA